jgi:polysaccharide biosynthesis/export protein
MINLNVLHRAVVLLLVLCALAAAGDVGQPPNSDDVHGLYRLGTGDEISVQQAAVPELDGKKARVDASGFVDLPLVGRVRVGGLTVEEAEAAMAKTLSESLLQPQPVISISEYRSQPVSVLGAVNTPGVIQLQGSKTLVEVISLAGGLRADAGGTAEITRRKEYGHLPLKNEREDPSGEFTTATIDLTALLAGQSASDNITVIQRDVISVPRAELIYVAGEVHKPGGFTLGATGQLSVLQALALAEGLGPVAAPKRARIFRPRANSDDKEEIPIDIAGILAGKTKDLQLRARDILFIPNSTSKQIGYHAAQAALQVAGIAVWRM